MKENYNPVSSLKNKCTQTEDSHDQPCKKLKTDPEDGKKLKTDPEDGKKLKTDPEDDDPSNNPEAEKKPLRMTLR